MYTDYAEAAYCKARIEQSTTSATASSGSCARSSHETMAALYKERLVGLTRALQPAMFAAVE